MLDPLESLRYMKEKDVKSVLDIGAHIGEYSARVKQLFPYMEVFLIEGNPYCENYLEQRGLPFTIACLSEEEKEIGLYMNPVNAICTGTSYYKETTHHYDNSIKLTVNTKKLDDVVDREFDFIKMDTQGSEIDIMKGGTKTLAAAKFVQIELSLIEYNKGAPLKDEVVAYMESIGFKPDKMVQVQYESYDTTKPIIQEDWIFAR